MSMHRYGPWFVFAALAIGCAANPVDPGEAPDGGSGMGQPGETKDGGAAGADAMAMADAVSGETGRMDATVVADAGGAGGPEAGPIREAGPDAARAEAGADSGASREAGGGADAGGDGGSPAGAVAGCTAPPAPGPLLGWAAVEGTAGAGLDVKTTTGGGSAMPLTVTTLAALNAAASGTTPAVIYVKGVLAAGTVKIGSNKTVAGICGAELHGHVDMSGSVNVIFRNLKVVGYNCSDSPTECRSGADAITVISGAHHLWFDHDDISDGSDGNLDITEGSDFVTVSWTKFWYSTARTDPVTGATGHRFSNLIGAADALPEDQGHLNITWHHDWWADNVAERMPRSRDGKIHVVNSLFTARGNDYCTNSGDLSSLLVESNVYMNVNNPIQEDANGNMLSRNNVFVGVTGSTTSMGTGFVPPYTLTPDGTANLAATLMAQVGPR